MSPVGDPMGQFAQQLDRCWSLGGIHGAKRSVVGHQALKTVEKTRILDVKNHRKDACGVFVGLVDDQTVVFPSIETEGFVKLLACHVTHVHGGEHG